MSVAHIRDFSVYEISYVLAYEHGLSDLYAIKVACWYKNGRPPSQDLAYFQGRWQKLEARLDSSRRSRLFITDKELSEMEAYASKARDPKRSKVIERCMGCDRPCPTLYCDACAPPSPARFRLVTPESMTKIRYGHGSSGWDVVESVAGSRCYRKGSTKL